MSDEGVKSYLRIKTEGEEERDWGFDKERGASGLKSYDNEFKDLLDDETFAEKLSKRKESGESTHVLDLFGSGHFVKGMNFVDSVTGARLENDRDESENVTVIEGNLYKGKPWKEIKKHAEEAGIDGYDLIVCKPEGPFQDISYFGTNYESEKRVYFVLLKRAVSLLSENNGELYTQIPQRISLGEEDIRMLQEELLQSGCEIKFGTGLTNQTMKVTRHLAK